MSHDTEQPPLSPLTKIRDDHERAEWEASLVNDSHARLLAAAVRARQALNDRLPNIAEGILEAAIDDGYRAIGRDLGDES